jgi:geranylgeranyl pyrophosphate synthase
LVHLYQHAPAGAQQQVRDLSQKRKLDSADVRQAVAIFTESGTLQAAETEIDRCIQQAEAALKPLTPHPAKEQLIYLLTRLSRRRF